MKLGSVLDNLILLRSLKFKENEKFVCGGFYSWLWIEGDNIEDCFYFIFIYSNIFGGNLKWFDFKEVELKVGLLSGFEDYIE